MVNTLVNKVLGENEKCVFYFYLKSKELSGQPIGAPLRLRPCGRSCASHAQEASPQRRRSQRSQEQNYQREREAAHRDTVECRGQGRAGRQTDRVWVVLKERGERCGKGVVNNA